MCISQEQGILLCIALDFMTSRLKEQDMLLPTLTIASNSGYNISTLDIVQKDLTTTIEKGLLVL